VWRASQRPGPAAPRRPVTWEIHDEGDALSLRADLEREGDMRGVDFREVNSRLNSVILTANDIQGGVPEHAKRLRQSLCWQRDLDAPDPHLPPVLYDELFGGWGFAYYYVPGTDSTLTSPVLRPACERTMRERQEERRWAVYHGALYRWASGFGFAVETGLGIGICRARVLHYWRIRECRELFTSSPSFAAVFGAPGLLAELDDPRDAGWRETALRLARLPRREWMERLGLPPTRQVVRLFARLQSQLVATHLPHIREVFADPAARKQLSDTSCTIRDYLLEYFLHPPVLRWPLMRSLCRRGPSPHSSISGLMEQLKFFRDEPLCGRGLIQLYRRARTLKEIENVSGFACWLRSYWIGLFQPGVGDALKRTAPPLTETGTIRHLNRPQDLIHLSAAHSLCLGKFIEPIIRGDYALYRIDYNGQFAVAGIKRGADGGWSLDEIRGARNTDATEEMKAHFLAWPEWQRDSRECPQPPVPPTAEV
jgi:hypothetical protein